MRHRLHPFGTITPNSTLCLEADPGPDSRYRVTTQPCNYQNNLAQQWTEFTQGGFTKFRNNAVLDAVDEPGEAQAAPGSRAAGLAMAFKLIESALDHWRMASAPHLVALVRAGAAFINGETVERPSGNEQPEAAGKISVLRS
jgi:hypothetical protein